MAENNEMVDVKQMLENTIVHENELLSQFDIGTNERKQIMDAFERLYKIRLEETKATDEYFNNEEKRNAEKEIQLERLKQELDMHKDKMRIEEARLKQDKENSEKDLEMRKAQLKAENMRSYLELLKAGVGVSLWAAMSFAIVRLEATGSMRSKAFTGTIPKFKFW